MAVTLPADTLPTVEQTGYSAVWDWKNEYVSNFEADGYERFAQLSASPDTTILYAGPARFPAVASMGATSALYPLGLVDGVQMSDNTQLTRLFEIGSNRSFFTRGKDTPTIQFQKLLADQNNVLYALMQASISFNNLNNVVNARGETSAGPTGPIPGMALNLNSEIFGAPFGMLIVFKTRGNANVGSTSTPTGLILTGVYLEYCMIGAWNLSVQSTQPVISEGVSIEFDRVVPVSFAPGPVAPMISGA